MVQTGLFSAYGHIVALCSRSVFLILILSSATLGQGSTPQRGFQPGASYALSDIETINTTNGNLSLHLPLGQLPTGRGGFSGQLNLHYDSKLYDSKTQWYQDWDHIVFGNPHVAIRNMLVASNEGGWHYGTGYELQLIDRMSQYPPEIAPQYPANETIYHYKVKVAFPDGSLHEFMPRVGSSIDQGYSDIRPDGFQSRFNGSSVQDFAYFTNNVNYYTFDGTYIRLEVQHDSDANPWNNPWTLYFPDGIKVTNFGKRITDRNGNYVEFSDITYNGHLATQLMDQLGRKIVIEYGGVNDGEVIHVPGIGGADLTYQVHWKSIQVFKTYSTVIGDHYSPDGYPALLAYHSVVSRIDLPSATGGLQYLFGYNGADSGSTPCCTPSYGWGELSSVTTPTGAQAQYQYFLDGQNGPGFDYTWDKVLRNAVKRKTLTYQQQYDGNSSPVSEVWEYTSENGLALVVNPDGGTVRQLNDAQRNYRTETPDGTVIEKIWAANRTQNFPPTSLYDEYTGIDAYDPQRVNGYVKTEFTSIKNASGTLIKTAIRDYNYDKNGNVTRVAEYDWVDYGTVQRTNGFPIGIPASAVVKRITTNTMALSTPDASDYTSNNADSYWNANSPSLRKAVAVTELSDGSATLSRTEFTYDDPATSGNVTQQKSWDSTKGALSNPLTSGNSISVSHQYDSFGNQTLSTDARGYQTQFVYGSVGGFTGLYPTQVKTAYQTSVQRTETREYDFSTGAVTRTTDVDNNISNSTTYDVFGRPTLVKAAEGKPEETRTSTSYSDVNRRVIVKSDLNAAGDEKLVTIQHYDQLGRVRLTRQLEDAATQSATDETTGIKVQTRYQYSGNYSYVLTSNPYRAATTASAGSEATMGWSRSKSDNGGRVIEVQTFAGATAPAPWGANASGTGIVSTAYDAPFTTATDQAGKVRRSMTDGLGRLTRVDEPDASGNLGATNSAVQPTTYDYDASGNLTTVNQGSQTRTFVYSSLSRLTSATNPESGTVSYQYDNNGNLRQKTDARGIVTTYEYDALNRNTSVNYSNTTIGSPDVPDITRFYDGATYGKGRFWYSYKAGNYTVGNNVEHTATDSYDALGRPLVQRQLFKLNGTWSPTYQTSRAYNRAGRVTTQTYPSGHAVAYNYDSAGRLADKDAQNPAFTGTLGDGAPRTYASGISYVSSGALQQEQFGTTTPVINKLFYNSRGQLAEIRTGTAGNDWNRGRILNEYSLQCSGAGCNATDNNGNLRKQQLYIPVDEQASNWTSWYQQYDYDSVNRLKRVHEYTGNPLLDWQQEYDYDRWGNRTLNATGTWIGNASNPPNPALNETAFDTLSLATNNRLYAPGDLGLPEPQRRLRYDAAGNLSVDSYTGAGERIYDAENRMTQAWANTQWQYYNYNADGQRTRRKINNQETWEVYGFDGELLAEYQANGAASSPQKEYGYRNGQLLVTAEPATAVNVTWTNAVGLSVNGNSLTKTAATGWGNAGATSAQSLTAGDGYVELTVADTTTHRFVGLSNGNSNADYTDVDFAIHPVVGGTIFIYEGGVSRGTFGSYTTGDVLRVGVEGGVVRYRKNGALLYTSTIAPSYPLLVDSALYGTGNTLSNVVISGAALTNTQSVSWNNVVGASVSGNSLTKTAATGWGNAGATSAQSLTAGDGYVELTVVDTTTHRFVGLSNGNSNSDYTDVDFAIHPVVGGTIFIYEGGVSRGTFGSYTTGDVLRVGVEGGVVRYRKNGALLYTSTITPSYPLLVDSALYGTGNTLSNVVISGAALTNTQSVSWNNVVGASVSGNSLTKTAATGWGNAGATSAQSLTAGDGYVELTVADTTTHRFVGLSNGNSNSDYTDVDFAIHPVVGGTIFIYEGGVSRGTFGSYTTGDVLRVGVEGGVVRYRKNGALLYTSTITPSYPLLVDSALYGTGNTLSNVVISDANGGSSGASSSIHWLVADHLGTPRLVIDQTGSLANVTRHDYLPFGEELFTIGLRTLSVGYSDSDGIRQQFTSKERDVETGLDYFGARYYSSTQGRFTSVDPYNIVREAQITAQSNPDEARSQLQRYLRAPQQWNRYAYVAGNPLKYIDPTGEYLELTGNEQEQEDAWKRIQNLVGAEGVKYIQKVQMCVKGHCGTYVEYKPQGPGNEMQAGFAASNKLNAFIGQIIDSNNTTEYRIATHFDTKFETGIALTSLRCGGGCTVGSDESTNGNTQIFVHPDSGNVTQMAFNVFMNAGKFEGAAQLDFYNDIVDAHEFGHAYANAIEGKPTRHSNETYQRSIEFENLQRGTHPMKGRRTGH